MALHFLGGIFRSSLQRIVPSGVQGSCELHHLASHLTTQPATNTSGLSITASVLSRKLDGLPQIAGGTWSLLCVRNKNTGRRDYFPKPRETKRVLMNSWKVRMSTPGGRKILMRRILKGRYYLCHPDY